jgi:hypothetical protein
MSSTFPTAATRTLPVRIIMALPVTDVRGLDFKHAETGEVFGTIRELSGDSESHPAANLNCLPFAEDGCGNAFVRSRDGRVMFWDHETDELTLLATDWDGFRQGCHHPEPVELDESQVESAWIDPALAKELGIDAPSDGWIKKGES